MTSDSGGTPAVSVVVPTFQRRELVKRAVASALSQTYADFELVVVDDGSTDGTGEALAGLGERIRYEWRPNAGSAAARNAGIELARGGIVAFLDSDDRWLPDHLAVVTQMLERHPEAVLASTCPRFEIRGNEDAADAREADLVKWVSAAGALGGFLPCAAVRRNALLEAGGFDERMQAAEDTDLYVRLAAIGPIVTVRRRTVVCQNTSGSARERARRSGHYLAGAVFAAGNLLALAERLPEPNCGYVLPQAQSGVHFSAAMRALDRESFDEVEAELRAGGLFELLGDRPLAVESRIRSHLRRAEDREVRLRAMSSLAEMWPDARACTPRYLRVLSVGSALRLGRPRQALRLARDWPLDGTAGFARRMAPTLKHRARRRLADRRNRGSEEQASRVAAPTVSVVVPTYQRRKQVGRAVDSVLSQTFGDFELIVVDDGSTDGTREALAALGDRISYVWQPNAGVAAARNAGLGLARGRIVAFLDSDNRWLPEHLAAAVGALEAHPDAVLASTVPCSHGDVPGGAPGAHLLEPLPRLLVGNSVGCLSAVVACRDAVLEAGGFDRRLRFTEDNDLWLRLAARGGRFVSLERPTVITTSGPRSLVATRARGEYLDELELSSEAVRAELEGRSDESALGWMRGREHLLGALRALDRGDGPAVSLELERARGLLPELAERPDSVVTHVELGLAGTDGRRERARRLRELARLWPEPGSAVAGVLRASALARHARPRLPQGLPVALAALAHKVMLRTGQGPLRPAWRLAHEGLARGVAAYLRRGDPALSAYVRGSLGAGEPVFGLSDVDLVIVVDRELAKRGGLAEVGRRWQRLTKLLPTICRRVVETPHVYGEVELGWLDSSTPLTRGVRWALAPSNRERLLERAGAERSRLYGLTSDWRLIAGRDRRTARRPQDPDIRRIAAWMELQFWWLQAFRACVEPAAPWAAYLCARLMTEPARIWLWLDRAERVDARGALIERAMAEFPAEEESLRGARALLDNLPRAPQAPVEEALLSLERMSQRIAQRVAADLEELPSTDVRLVLDGAGELAVPAASLASVGRAADLDGPPEPLPLVDWRARVWSLPPDECLVPLSVASPDPVLLGRLALACNGGAYAGQCVDDLLVLPSLKRARMRAVQCSATDPVSFALLAGASSAAFPEVPGWSARHSARRAVAEHLGWLRGKGREADGVEALGRLLSAARAALFLDSVESGAPELVLTAGAVADRLASAAPASRSVAGEAYESYRRGRLDGGTAPRDLVAALRAEVSSLSPYASRMADAS